MLKLALLIVVLVVCAACGSDNAGNFGSASADRSFQEIAPATAQVEFKSEDQHAIDQLQARADALEQQVRELESVVLALQSHIDHVRSRMDELAFSLDSKTDDVEFEATVDRINDCLEDLVEVSDEHVHFLPTSRLQPITMEPFIHIRC